VSLEQREQGRGGGVVPGSGGGEHDQTPPHGQPIHTCGRIQLTEQLGQQRHGVRVPGEVLSDEVLAKAVRPQRKQRRHLDQPTTRGGVSLPG
jgi:hypothetical protein